MPAPLPLTTRLTMTKEAIAVPIREMMQRSFEGRSLADDDDIFATGFGNSLFALQLVTFVEQKFNIEIDSEDLDIENFRTIRKIADLVERKQAVHPAGGV